MIPDKRYHQVDVLSELYDHHQQQGGDQDNITTVLNRKEEIDRDMIDQLQQQEVEEEDCWAPIQPSSFARNTINPIRRIVDAMNVQPNPEKPLLKLHIGDPSVTGVLPTHESVNRAVLEALVSGQYNGYGPAVGFAQVRRALAEFIMAATASSNNNDVHPATIINPDDIILTSGCSHGLQMAIEALAESGGNILVPKPGFPLYETLMHPLGIEPRHYNLLADRNWEIDLEQMESLIDHRTAAVIVNNPNNPTGAVYSREHLQAILKLAHKHRVPVIADEIYGDMVFGGAEFHPLHTLRPKVPMLTCDGISKRYLVPGWRLGWLVVHDVDDCLAKVRAGLCQLAQKIVGPCSLMQGALPAILRDTPGEFFQHTRDVLSENVDLVMERLSRVPGIEPIRAQGAMYMMIKIDTARSFPKFTSSSAGGGDDDLEFVQALISEESLYCLPGSAFYYPGAIRFVLAHSAQSMIEACDRLRSFCARHYQAQSQPTMAPESWSLERPSPLQQYRQRRKVSLPFVVLAGNSNTSNNSSKIILSPAFAQNLLQAGIEAQ